MDVTLFLHQELNEVRIDQLSPKSKLPITMKCPDCSLIWKTSKNTLLQTGCPSCRKEQKSFWATEKGLEWKEKFAITLTNENKYDTEASSELYDLRCTECNTWLRLPLNSALKREQKYATFCGVCNPQHRVKTGALLIKNNPQIANRISPDTEAHNDFYIAQSTPIKFLFDCGHYDDEKPLKFLRNQKACRSCTQLLKETEEDALGKRFAVKDENTFSGTCEVCKEELSLQRAVAKGIIKDNKQVLCRKCKYKNGLFDLTLWENVKWSSNNRLPSTEFTTGSGVRAEFECLAKGHNWSNFIYAAQDKCPQCYSKSGPESEIAEYLDTLNVHYIQNDRKVLHPKELDFLIPDHSLAIEYNGLFWHRETKLKDRNYHYSKFIECQKNNLSLFTIWESDWVDRKALVKEMIAYKLGVSHKPRVPARKTVVKVIDSASARQFLEVNHLQGASRSTVFLGGFFEGSLVSVMGFTLLGTVARLDRFATSVIYQGGFTKLLQHFLKTYECQEVVTFSDNCYSDGGLYSSNGFVRVKDLKPDYKYVVGKELRHKFNFRLDKFRKDPNLKFQEGLSEASLAKLNNLDRVWDCGKVKWKYDLTSHGL
jgi:hypothetical protein